MITAIVQARLTSERFPRKVLAPICNGINCIDAVIQRLSRSKFLDNVIIAIPDTTENDELDAYVRTYGDDVVFRGSENDVLGRVYSAAQTSKASIIVDITADCPLVDSEMVDQYIDLLMDDEYEQYDYISNCMIRTYPDGFDVQVYTIEALEAAHRLVTDQNHRCHAGWNIYYYREAISDMLGRELQILHRLAENIHHHPEWRLTLDTPEDLVVIQQIFSQLGWDVHLGMMLKFGCNDVIKYILEHPSILNANSMIEGKIPGEG